MPAHSNLCFFLSFVFLSSGSFRASPKALQVTFYLKKQRRENVADDVLTLALMKVIVSTWCLFNVLIAQIK